MNTTARAFLVIIGLATTLIAQPIPIYKSQEDYCYHNPDAPTCTDGKPLKMLDLSKGAIYKGKPLDLKQPMNTPAKAQSQAAAPAMVSTPPARTASGPPLKVPQPWHKRGAPGDVRLGEADWRLLHSDPDMFIGLNIAGLAESELARTLIAQWAGKLGATEAEQRTLVDALGDIPQAVISIQRKEIIAVLTGRVESIPDQTMIGGLQTMHVSADTVVLGSPNAVRWAVWRLNFGLTPSAVASSPTASAIFSAGTVM